MHQIGQCEAPCVGKITKADYAGIVLQVKHFFEGKADLLTREMTPADDAAFRGNGI